jgi:hypothetical protein
MRNRLLTLLTVFAVLSFATVSFAQDEEGDVFVPSAGSGYLIGPVGGINMVAYSTNSFAMLQSEPDCFTAKDGSAIQPWGGLSFELPLGSKYTNFLVIEALYDGLSSKFGADQTKVKETRQTKYNGVVRPGTVTTDLSANLAYMLVNVAYKYNFTEGPAPVGPGIQVGPSIGVKMSAKETKTVTVSAAPTPMSESGSQTVSNEADVVGAESLRIAMRGQFTYDIPLTPDWFFTPTVGYDFPVTKVEATRAWSASNMFGGVYFRYLVK